MKPTCKACNHEKRYNETSPASHICGKTAGNPGKSKKPSNPGKTNNLKPF